METIGWNRNVRETKRYRWLFWLTTTLIVALQTLIEPAHAAPYTASVIISEFLANNKSDIVDEDGDYSDWIEIHNRGARTIDLAGWALSDDPDQPDKWLFPSIELKSGSYLLVFASGKDRRDVEYAGTGKTAHSLHTNFKLDADDLYLSLADPTSHASDSNIFQGLSQLDDVSCGHDAEQIAHRYFGSPTPGQPNDWDSPTWAGILDPAAFSVLHGFFDEPFSLVLATDMPGATIRFTIDGSEPTSTHGLTYGKPIRMDGTTTVRAGVFAPDYLPAPTATQTYIFLDDVLSQPAEPAGFPATWGTHRISFGGYSAGEPVAGDYEMDPQIVSSAAYSETMREALLSLPSVSIVTDMENLDIYFSDPQMRGSASERPASIEMLYPDDEESGFQIDAGIRIHGGAGRWEYMPKHSFRLLFKDEYGPAKLEYPVFADSPVTEFDTLVLRAGVDRGFAGDPNTEDHRQTTYSRDEWMRATQIEMSGLGSHGSFVHVYLNGLYWGIYNLVERPDESFAASHLGGEREDWYAGNQGGPISGLSDRFDALCRLAEAGGLADPDQYATMLEFIDPVQFCDYLILNWYAGNQDWPDNNWYVNVQFPAGRNLFLVWDAECTWSDGADIRLGEDESVTEVSPNVVKLVFEALMENPEFRTLLSDRFQKHLANGGALTDENAVSAWMEVNNGLEPAIVAESARWGDARYDDPIDLDDWHSARDDVVQQMQGNAEKLSELAREAGYYPTLDPPVIEPHGEEFEGAITVTMDSSEGVTYVTVDGSDPRIIGGGDVSSTAFAYTGPIALTQTTRIRARTLLGNEWSALTEADFIDTTQPSGLRITELMYHAVGGDEYEYIEIQNVGGIEIDLSRAYFDGIRFRFERNTTLGPGEYSVLAADYYAYRERYPTALFRGMYEGKLSNGGETIALYDAGGENLASVSYDDGNGWPRSADGRGDSIVFVNVDGDPDDPDNWRASAETNGSPGRADGP